MPTKDRFQIIDMGEIVRQKISPQTAVKGCEIEKDNNEESAPNKS